MIFYETVSHSIIQAGLKCIAILLPQPPKCWDYTHEPFSWDHKHEPFFFFLRRNSSLPEREELQGDQNEVGPDHHSGYVWLCGQCHIQQFAQLEC